MVPENSPEPSECSKNDKFNRKITVGENIHQRSTISKNEFNFNLKNYNLLIK